MEEDSVFPSGTDGEHIYKEVGMRLSSYKKRLNLSHIGVADDDILLSVEATHLKSRLLVTGIGVVVDDVPSSDKGMLVGVVLFLRRGEDGVEEGDVSHKVEDGESEECGDDVFFHN